MKMTKAIRKEFQKLGSEGGKKSSANMTPEQRSERAKKAVAVREAKKKAANE